MPADCPFCRMEKLTEWYVDAHPLVVCRDLHDRGYAFRVLGLMRGEDYHGELEEIQKGYIVANVEKVAEGMVAAGKADSYVLDFERRSVPDHWHVQACMKKIDGTDATEAGLQRRP